MWPQSRPVAPGRKSCSSSAARSSAEPVTVMENISARAAEEGVGRTVTCHAVGKGGACQVFDTCQGIARGIAACGGAAAKVISLSTLPNVCEVVPATMTYEDHQGQRHTIEYRAMGDGCSQG